MFQYKFGDRTGRFAEDIREHVVKLQVRHSQATLNAVFFTGQNICQIEPIAHQVAKVTNVRRWNKTWPDHITHEQIANKLCVFTVCIVAPSRLSVLRVSERNKADSLKDVEYWNLIFPR